MWILPVFYDIEPSQVRHQTGSFEEAFAMHEHGRFKDNNELIQKWRLALHQAADLSGLHFKIGREHEYEFIRNITKEISGKLNRPALHIADYPVGLKDRIQQVQLLIGDELDTNATMLGIHGIGGIGKSTLARAIYNLIANQFEGSYFLANIREKSSKHGLVHIQETMLAELIGEKNIKLGDIYHGIAILRQKLCRKKVLLVLDDVNKKEQLQATAGGLDWFGSGSIIIVITRDKHLLDIHGVEKLYEVDSFNDTEALEMFKWYAFKNKEIDPSYEEVIERAIYHAYGLPLALEIIGSNLCGKKLDEWKSGLEAYERIPQIEVQEILRVSYDGLEENEKEIFLDIACFFRGCTVSYVTNMLEARGFHARYGINVLEEKSLIKIWRCHGEVGMHDLIQSMGKEIVRQQSSTSPQKRSRLYSYEDIIDVLEKNMENDIIEAIMLDVPEDEEIQWEVFGKMKNLRMMLIKKNGGLNRSPLHLPNSLRVLQWRGYPAASLPSNFHSKKLVILDLSYSCFRWNKPLEESKVLKHLILAGCKYIRQIPDLSGFPNLTGMCVEECTNLIEIHSSVGFLNNLKSLCAKGCTKLKIGPSGIKLPSLEYLCLRDCSSLVIFPEILAPMKKLNYVDLDGTAIKNLPLSMQNLEGLQRLSLQRCKMLESTALSKFFKTLPESFPKLTKLYLQDSNLTILPECIEKCHFLKTLYVFNCKQLQEIRGLPPNITNFSAENTSLSANSSTLKMLINWGISSSTRRYYILPGQRIPECFDHSSNGNSLCFWFRKKLPSLTVCAVSGVWDIIEPPFYMKFNFYVQINDCNVCVYCCGWHHIVCIKDHITMVNLGNNFHYPMNLDVRKALSTNEWICGKVSFVVNPKQDICRLGLIKWTGVYVNRACSTMEDVRFTDPYPPNDSSDMGNQLRSLSEAPDIQQQQERSLALFNPTILLDSQIKEQPLNYVGSNSNSLDGAFLDHQAMVPTVAETQNIEGQREMGTFISEALRDFNQYQSRDCIEASMNVEFTTSESQKVDDVGSNLETKKNQFSIARDLENKLHQKLTTMKKIQEDLKEQLNYMKANISAVEVNNSCVKADISSIKANISAPKSERNKDC